MGNSTSKQLYKTYLDHIKELKIDVEPPLSEPFFSQQSRFLSNPEIKDLIHNHQSTYSYTMKNVGEGKKVDLEEFIDSFLYVTDDQEIKDGLYRFIHNRFPIEVTKTSSLEEVNCEIKKYKEGMIRVFGNMESYMKNDFVWMNELILNSPPLDREYVVYRGLEFTERGKKASDLTKAFSKIRVGETLRIETYFSISLAKYISEGYSGPNCCLLVIRLKKGSHCLFFFTSPFQRENQIYLLEGLVEPCTLLLNEIRGESRLEYCFDQL